MQLSKKHVGAWTMGWHLIEERHRPMYRGRQHFQRSELHCTWVGPWQAGNKNPRSSIQSEC